MSFDFGDLGDAPFVTATFERSREEDGQNLFSQTDANDAGTDTENVRIVVLTGHAGRIQIVTERGTDTAHFVGSELLTLPTPTEHDPDVGVAVSNGTPHSSTDGGVVTALRAVRAVIVDTVTCRLEDTDEVFLQFETGMVGPDSYAWHVPSVEPAVAVASNEVTAVASTAMSLDPRTPILIGGGQYAHHAAGIDDAMHPVELMAEAVRRATTDAGLNATPDPDSIRVVSLLTWRYGDPAYVLGQHLGRTPRETVLTTNGGNSPQTLVNSTALNIQNGDIDIAILAGAEASRTRMKTRREGIELHWPKAPEGQLPRVMGDDLEMSHAAERAQGIYLPVHVYPMFETAIRAAAGRSVGEQLQVASELWARFSDVAAKNPNAWIQKSRTAEEIRTPTPSNRIIGFPYTKYMNSNNDVDMGAALIMCSVEKARALGVPSDRWVFIHSGADCHEHSYMSNRYSFSETPAIELGGRLALEGAGLTIDDIDIVDLYSCFPSAVQLGAKSLGLSLERQLTRTGGLSFAGGPWNNYVMHAIATTMNDLRSGAGTNGLVWGNGGYATKHSFGVYSTIPTTGQFRHVKPQDQIDAMARREMAEGADAAGPVTIEAYTVMHGREGRPETAFAACLLADGRRAWASSPDVDVASAMCEGEWVGRAASLNAEGRLTFA